MKKICLWIHTMIGLCREDRVRACMFRGQTAKRCAKLRGQNKAQMTTVPDTHGKLAARQVLLPRQETALDLQSKVVCERKC